MIDLLDIRYVRLGTRDLVGADRFAREVVGLEAARTGHGARYYRSDARDHTLVYIEGDPAEHVVGFEVRDAPALDAAAALLSDSGTPVARGSA
jgi:2,3-dihydroxy-p-cumate/2,3-dihydroxybenzoate 3,4-dioxygenase